MKTPRPWQIERARAAAERLRRELAFVGHARTVSLGMIVVSCSEEFGVPLLNLLSDERGQGVTLARHAAMALAHRLARRSLPVIGRAMNRDHTTVLHGVRRHEQRVAKDPVLAARMAALSARLEERIKHA